MWSPFKRKPKPEKIKIIHPTEHFEICPITDVPITRKLSKYEVTCIINRQLQISVQIINYLRYLDKLPPFNLETNIYIDSDLEWVRFYHYAKDEEFLKSLDDY